MPPTTNDTANVGAIVGEGATTSAQDATFAQLVLDGWKYSSKAILVSVELLQDSAINLPAFIGNALGTRIGRISNTHFTTGTGTGQRRACGNCDCHQAQALAPASSLSSATRITAQRASSSETPASGLEAELPRATTPQNSPTWAASMMASSSDSTITAARCGRP